MKARLSRWRRCCLPATGAFAPPPRWPAAPPAGAGRAMRGPERGAMNDGARWSRAGGDAGTPWAHSRPDPVCGLRSAVCGLRSAVCGLRSAVCGLRSAVCGLRSAVNIVVRLPLPSLVKLFWLLFNFCGRSACRQRQAGALFRPFCVRSPRREQLRQANHQPHDHAGLREHGADHPFQQFVLGLDYRPLQVALELGHLPLQVALELGHLPL